MILPLTLNEPIVIKPISEAPLDGSEILAWCPDIGWRVLIYDIGWCLSGSDSNAYEPTAYIDIYALKATKQLIEWR